MLTQMLESDRLEHYFPKPQIIVAGEQQRDSKLFCTIGRNRQNLSDVRSETCAVDCVFYIRAFRDACECTYSTGPLR